MYILKFWKSWPPVYQKLWWSLAGVLTISLAIVVIAWVLQPAPTYTWQQFEDLERQDVPIYNVEAGGVSLPVIAENYIIYERWHGNPIQIDGITIDIYLAFFSLALIVLLSIITTLPRFWFLLASGITAFLISSLQLDILEIFGLTDKIPTIAALLVLIGIGLYYQFLNNGASFLQRLLVYAFSFGVIGLLIANYSPFEQPLRYLAINTIPVALVMLVLFVILIAHEIMASLVSLVGKGTRNSKSLRHYLILSSAFLINLWLTYLDRINWIDWTFTLSPLLLLLIAGVLAIWGIRQRQPQYENIIQADPFAVYFIIAMGIISFGTIGYLLITSNDVVLLSINDLILYANIGYGMIFLMYVISNFMPMLSANFQVHRVLYKPTVMPYFSYRIAGLIFTLAILFYNNWVVPVNHFISGYNTALGDLFVIQHDGELANGYYKRAYYYAPYNQHAASALAEMEEHGGTGRQRQYREGANSYRPTEYTETSLASAYAGRPLEALISLQDARAQLPKSGIIKNNLGIAFSKLGLADSAYQSFLQAAAVSTTKASAEMNLLGVLAHNRAIVNADSIYQRSIGEKPRIKSNALAIANSLGKVLDVPIEFPKDSILDLFSASFIGNYITNHINQPDTALLNHCVRMANRKENRGYKEIIIAPIARALYAAGQVNRAFGLLQEANAVGNTGRYNSTLAVWALDHGKSDVAIFYMQPGVYTSSRSTSITAVALAEAGKINEAIVTWDTINYKKDTVLRSIGESMKRVLGGPLSWYGGFTENEKYQYLHYRVAIEDSVQFNSLLGQITNEDFRAKAILDRSKKWFDRDDISRAAFTYKKLQGLHLTDMNLFGRIKYYELRLFAAQGQWQMINDQVKKGLLFGPYHETEHTYYSALAALAAGDTTKAATDFNRLVSGNYYFDDGIVAAAAFFQRHGSDKRKAYLILSEALQVNPNSIKILKAYIPAAITREYTEYAASALNTLRTLLSPTAFHEFVTENHLSGLLL